MMSNCLFNCTRCLKASTAKLPFSAISTECPYFSRILTASFWLTRLSSASKMSKTTSLGAETGFAVFDSRAAIKADARSCEVTGVVTWELILLSKHHLTTERYTQSTNEEAEITLTIKPRHRRSKKDDRDISKVFVFANSFGLGAEFTNVRMNDRGSRSTYHLYIVHDNSIYMWAMVPICHRGWIMNDMNIETEFFYPRHNACSVP